VQSDKYRPRHAAPSTAPRRVLSIGITALIALVVSLGAVSLTHERTTLPPAPVDLVVPLGLSGADLHQWCVERQAAGTAGLSTNAKNWLRGCIEVTNPLPSPSPSPSPSASPTASPSPSPSPSPTATPTATPSPSTSPSPSPTVTPSPSPSPTPTGPVGCPVAGTNVPGGADPWGGCFPGPGNTGVPAGTTLTNYTGPCALTIADTVIDSKIVNCDLNIQSVRIVIKNSVIHGMIDGGEGTGSSFTLQDSLVDNPADDNCLCVGSDNFTVLRSEIRGAYREIYCRRNCVVTDTWVHGQQLIQPQHASGIRQEQGSNVTHSTLSCDWPHPDDNTSMGCSADLGGYPDFAPVNHNTYHNNLFIGASRDPNNVNPPGPGATTGFCAFGGNTSGKPFSSDPTNGTFQVFTDNVWQRGQTGVCGDFGPITDFSTTKTGNVWSGNVWDNGGTVNPA